MCKRVDGSQLAASKNKGVYISGSYKKTHSISVNNLRVLLGALVITCTACSPRNVSIDTLINLEDPNYDEINQLIITANNNNTFLVFNSEGGMTDFSLRIAKLLQVKQTSIKITRECTSGCAEILLAAAHNVYFENKPIIGFHGNILSYRYYVDSLAVRDKNKCGWRYAEETEILLAEKSLNKFFWREQMKRLNPDVTFNYKLLGCPEMIDNFENQMWLPTSQQLRELYGLEFSGEVCSDHLKSCAKRINKLWPKGTRIVVGDAVYTSKG